MAPPPRPPIICYDLQASANARRTSCARQRIPLAGAVRKTKVTVLQKDPNELERAKASACWLSGSNLEPSTRLESLDYIYDDDRNNNYLQDDEYFDADNLENSRPDTATGNQQRLFVPRKQQAQANTRDRVYTRALRHDLVDPEPYQFKRNPFHCASRQRATTTTTSLGSTFSSTLPFNTTKLTSSCNARHAYGERLKHEAEERERRRELKKRQVAMQAQLEVITAQLESAKRVQENLLKTFGMSHNTAKYIRKQDEDFAQLRKKVDQFAETRSKELGRRVQQMRKFQQLQQSHDREAEEKRLSEMSKSTTLRSKQHTLNRGTTLNNSLSGSPTTNTTSTNTTASSSSPTISISSCSSPMSTADEPLPSLHFVESPPSSEKSTQALSTNKHEQNPNLLSSTILNASNHDNSYISTLPNASHISRKAFSFYKPNPLDENETLEVTDMDFFEKVEDKTMLEVNELLNKMQSVLKDFNEELQ